MDTLTRMRTFVEVVDAGGFSAAARKMGRSKALISKYVRELEDELGARLLNRTTRTLSLTEVGQSYARDATEILQRIEDLQSSIGDAHAAPRGRLKVSAPRTFGDGRSRQAAQPARPLAKGAQALLPEGVRVASANVEVHESPPAHTQWAQVQFQDKGHS